jgi:hypothetical protein
VQQPRGLVQPGPQSFELVPVLPALLAPAPPAVSPAAPPVDDVSSPPVPALAPPLDAPPLLALLPALPASAAPVPAAPGGAVCLLLPQAAAATASAGMSAKQPERRILKLAITVPRNSRRCSSPSDCTRGSPHRCSPHWSGTLCRSWCRSLSRRSSSRRISRA